MLQQLEMESSALRNDRTQDTEQRAGNDTQHTGTGNAQGTAAAMKGTQAQDSLAGVSGASQ